MLHSVLTGIDRVSFAAAAAAMVMILGLIASMIYEVGARYLFGAPTIWSCDVSYMLNGSLFILGAALTLAKNNHVRIDFLSSRLLLRTQHPINLVFYVLLFLPALGFAAWSSIGAAWGTLISGEVEAVSPWAPVIWPFNSAIAIGFSAFWLQAWRRRRGTRSASPIRTRCARRPPSCLTNAPRSRSW